MSKGEKSTADRVTFDPWYCNARPIWPSLIHVIPVNDELLKQCLENGILSDSIVSCIISTTPEARRRSYVSEKNPAPCLCIEGHPGDSLPYLHGMGFLNRINTAPDCTLNCGWCNQYLESTEILLHGLRLGGSAAYYKFWEILSLVYPGDKFIKALCSFMSDRTLNLIGTAITKGMRFRVLARNF